MISILLATALAWDTQIETFERQVPQKWVARGQRAKARTLGEAMQEHGIPGMSIAIWADGKIVLARGYGVVKEGQDQAPNPETLFQAGSVSKPVAATGVMLLVQRGVLKLEDPVGLKLRTWKLPASTFTAKKQPTLRQLLSHTSGLGVHGFLGYSSDQTLPGLRQVAEGVAPANSPALHFIAEPGERWSYSGGGYVVLQQVVEDTVKRGFAEFMGKEVLKPLGMTRSSFVQPLPADQLASAAFGHERWRQPIRARANIHPELAAAGLWTTPSDLATFGMSIQATLSGSKGNLLNPSTAEQMLTPIKNNYGLGFMIAGTGKGSWFMHGGRNRGFDTLFEATTTGQCGIAIMVNANCDTGFLEEVKASAGRAFGWSPPNPMKPSSYQPLSDEQLDGLAGSYAVGELGNVSVMRHGFRLHCTIGGTTLIALTPRTETEFEGSSVKVTFKDNTLTLAIGSRKWSGKKKAGGLE